MDATAPLPTGTVTFLFTDIEDEGAEGAGPVPGTRLWEEQPEAMRRALVRYGAPCRRLRARLALHDCGHEIPRE